MPFLATALIACSLFAGSPYAANAATLLVPSEYTTIQAAITAASSGDTVEVGPSTYTGAGNVNINFGGKSITVESTGGAADTIINCQGDSQGFIFQSSVGALNGFTIENGNSNGGDGNGGGAIEIVSGTPTIENCIFESDTAPNGNGGGIAIVNGDPQIVNCAFTNCTTTSNGTAISDIGGNPSITGCTFTNCSVANIAAVYFNDAFVTLANATFTGNIGGAVNVQGNRITITDSQFTGNGSATNNGGAIYIFNPLSSPVQVTVDNSTFTSNSAFASGGAIYIAESQDLDFNSGPGTLSLSGCSFSDNKVINGNTGAGAIDSEAFTVAIIECTFTGNTGYAGGPGGVYINGHSLSVTDSTFSNDVGGGIGLDNGAGTISGCSFSNNSASEGSGGAIFVTNGGSLQLENSTFFNNTALNWGGALNINSANPLPGNNSPAASIINCTFNGNGVTASTPVGAAIGVQNTSLVTLLNDIVYGDVGSTDTEIAVDSASAADATYSDIGGGYTGTGNLNVNPMWVAPSGTTPDFHLQADSECYEAGYSPGAPTTTEDGYPRPTKPSMGAYELRPPLTASPGNEQVALAWTASAIATSYSVYRGTSAGGESSTPVATGVATTAFTDTGLTNGVTYYYNVGVLDSVGTIAQTNEASATPEPPIAPVPTDLKATGGIAEVSLSWTASAGATSYDLYRSTMSGGEGTTPINALPITSTSYTDTGLASGTEYYYTVAAVNGGGTSGQSAEASALTVPSTPTGLVGVAGNAQAVLTWNASVKATSYSLYRSTTAAEGTTAYKTVTTTSYTDTGLTNGTTYYYTVAAANGSGTSAQSSPPVPVTPGPIPLAPTGVTATAGVDQVTIAWTARTGATSYDLFRSTTSGGEGTTVYQTSTTSPYVDTAVSAGITYYYTVAAVSAAGTSASQSAEVHAMPIPAAPTGVTGVSGNGEVTVSWTASAGATAYNVNWLAPGWTAYRLDKNTTALTYTQTGLSDGVAYSFEVAAIDAGGTSPPSTSVTGTPLATPAGLTATPANAQVTLAWTASAGATAYNVYRGTTAGGESATPVGLAAGTPYTDTGLTDGVKYFYKIAGVNASGTSTLSAEVSATPLLLPPSGPTATAGDTQITLAWTASIGATSYSVYRGTAVGGEGSTPVKAGITGTTYLDTGLTNGKTYYYKVVAVNAAMTSAESSEVHATPVGLAITTGSITINWSTNLPASAVVNYGTSATALTSSVSSPVATSQSITLTGLTLGQIYYYQVVSTDAAGNSVSMPVSTFTP